MVVTDPAAGAEAARTADEHLRRAGAQDYLQRATTNLFQALLQLGDWDAAEDELTRALDSDGLTNGGYLSCCRGWLAALRGDTATAETILAGLADLRASEDPQDKALISVVEAFTAAALGQPGNTLRHARGTLAYADALGISHDCLRWAWPLAARTAHELADTATVRDLLALLDPSQPGHLASMLRAERDLVRARLADHDGGEGGQASFASAIGSLREMSTPYHLAHGLLDYSQHLTRMSDNDAAAAASGEARDIARRLRCQPLLDRAATTTPAEPPVRA